MTESLDVVAIGIEHERAVVILVIMQTQSRRAVVLAAGRERGLVKSIDGCPVWRKGDMGAGLRNALDADLEERLVIAAITGAIVLDMQPFDAKRA